MKQVRYFTNVVAPILLLAALLAALLYVYVLPDPNNERVVEGLVNNAYQVARNGGEQQYAHRKWENIERQYGRVLSWHVLGEHRTLPVGDWVFDVQVTRERHETREHVTASAGPSKVYGYYSSVSDVEVESANARPGGN